MTSQQKDKFIVEMNITKYIEDYVEGYELRGDNGDYLPTEQEKFLIMDCIMGLIEEKEFYEFLKGEK